MLSLRNYMLQKRIQGNKSSAVLILSTFLVCLVFAAAGAIIAAGIINTTNPATISDGLGKNLQLIAVDIIIFIAAVVIATVLSRKLGFSVSSDKKTTKNQVRISILGIIGIVSGLVTWNSLIKTPAPSILLPIVVVAATQICMYIFASSFVFTSSDPMRKKVWTPIVFMCMLAAPSLILYTFVTRK
jgi:hypothetical protein